MELTSSGKKIADFNENGELGGFKTGMVTVTAKTPDDSNAKTNFKLPIVKKVQSLTLKEDSDQTVTGGKSLKCSPLVKGSPNDASNKKLNRKGSDNDAGAKISSSG